MEKKKIRIQITPDDVIFFGRYKERQFKNLPDNYLTWVAYNTHYGNLFSDELKKLAKQALKRESKKIFSSHDNASQDPTDLEWHSEMYYEPPH